MCIISFSSNIIYVHTNMCTHNYNAILIITDDRIAECTHIYTVFNLKSKMHEAIQCWIMYKIHMLAKGHNNTCICTYVCTVNLPK